MKVNKGKIKGIMKERVGSRRHLPGLEVYCLQSTIKSACFASQEFLSSNPSQSHQNKATTKKRGLPAMGVQQ
jgi:hypothetical protein